MAPQFRVPYSRKIAELTEIRMVTAWIYYANIKSDCQEIWRCMQLSHLSMNHRHFRIILLAQRHETGLRCGHSMTCHYKTAPFHEEQFESSGSILATRYYSSCLPNPVANRAVPCAGFKQAESLPFCPTILWFLVFRVWTFPSMTSSAKVQDHKISSLHK